MSTVIKRYGNRKLYDTSAKRYISLDGVAEIIRQGMTITVVDDGTGEDITNITLMQIIIEQEKKRIGVMPRALLVALIRSGGRNWRHAWQSVSSHLSDFTEFLEPSIRKFLIENEFPTREDIENLKVQLDQLDQRISSLQSTKDSR